MKQKVKPGTAKRMLSYALPYTGLLALFLIVVIIDASIGIVNPLIYREVINEGILKGNAPLIVRLAIIVGGLGLFDGALGIAQTFLASKIGAEIVLSIRNRLFAHIQSMPLAFFTRTQTGALVSRLNTDVQGARTAFTDILSNVVGNLITVLLILGAMFVLSWRITLGALILLPIFVLPARYWGRKLQAITRETYDLAGNMNNLMVERFNVAGALLSKLFGRPEEDARVFNEKAQRVSDISIKLAIYGRLFFTALAVVATVASALAYGWGGVLAVHHVLDVGTVVAITALLARLYAPLVGLSNVQVSIMTALVSFERVFEVLDLKPMIQENPRALPIPAGPASIEFDRVSFRYPSAAEVSLASLEAVAVPDKRPQTTVLHEISFRIEPGQFVALVGPSGAGKTTITQLVPRLYDPQSGAVQISGIDVRELKLESLNRRIGVVTQDAHLFHDTIRANLLYAKPDASDQQIYAALRDAQILGLVESLPDKLDTMVGERGYRFSGGEKQRIAIARLLLKGPDIVILDEATAHLDSESEAAIQRALETALAGRTSIVIAHRLSTILKADEILVVQNGRIVQRGTHAALLAEPGIYTELYQRQFAEAGAKTHQPVV
ncbi:ABC transporter ATP-binding protein [Occallatibacter riparius]|uniref:ABC transporter ATP-binding protein/permease n=1 Tax=Occallatibacter riparius TaxID=1002689 RepID=A0A9J7BI21_9BACT|nr:ABC transporter ATP-binding protein [Occallatibacter riparius]UWZ82448.1 ABC transporter ATP-binding protein/permease [Occallatibacter riparius]